jgi:glutathione S-transferase
MARFELYGHIISGPNYRVALMLHLCGEPFVYHHVDLRAGVHKSPDYLCNRNRYGQVPALHDTERDLCLVQSAAILEYLADTLGKLNGDSEAERLEAREWCYWETDVMERILRLRGYTIGYITAPPDVVTHYREEGLAALGALDNLIGERDWVCGGKNPTFADVYIYGSVGLAHEADLDIQAFSNVARWAKAFQELKGYGRPKELLPRP